MVVLVILWAFDFVSARLRQWVRVYLTLVKVHVSDHVATDEGRAAHAEVRHLTVLAPNCLEQLYIWQMEIHLLVHLFQIALNFYSTLKFNCDSNEVNWATLLSLILICAVKG